MQLFDRINDSRCFNSFRFRWSGVDFRRKRVLDEVSRCIKTPARKTKKECLTSTNSA